MNDYLREFEDLQVIDATHTGFTLLFGERRFRCEYRFTFPQPTPPPGSPVPDPESMWIAIAVCRIQAKTP